jgi:hypothetical protein
MKRPKPMNRQLSLSLGPEPTVCETGTELGLQQREEVERALMDLLLNSVINSGTYREGSDDK